MNFLYPGFLWALTALAVPVIIHLFFFRRYKKVFFSNVRFLREIKEETDTRNRLRNLLILLSRLLAFAALIFAFAQPFIPSEDTQIEYDSRAVSLYLDNSFSMDAQGEARSLFETAREKVREIALAYEPSDRFQLITNDLEGRHQRLVSREEMLTMLAEVQISPRTPGTKRIYSRQVEALGRAEESGRFAYLISDFQSEGVQFEPDSAVATYLVPVSGVEQRNIAVDSAWMEAPVQVQGQKAAVRVKVHNYGSEDADQVALRLNINGQPEAIGELSVPANTVVEDTLVYTVDGSGWQEAEVSITDYPVTFDDTWYMSYEVADEIPVLIVSESSGNPFLQQLFRASETAGGAIFKADQKQAGAVDYSELLNYRLIILDGPGRISSGFAAELEDFLNSGGNVLVFPSADAEVSSYNAFFRKVDAATLGNRITRTREVVSLNTSSGVFGQVFESNTENMALPSSSLSYQLSAGALSREENLMQFRDGGSFLGRWPVGPGSLFICASPLNRDATDLPVQGAIIAPLLFNTAVMGNSAIPVAHRIGDDDWIPVRGLPDGDFQPLVKSASAAEFLPQVQKAGKQVRIQVDDQVNAAGFYKVFAKSGATASEDALSTFALNFSRSESALEFENAKSLKDRYGEAVQIIEANDQKLAAAVTRINEGQRLWKLCLILALVFLAAETLLVRLL